MLALNHNQNGNTKGIPIWIVSTKILYGAGKDTCGGKGGSTKLMDGPEFRLHLALLSGSCLIYNYKFIGKHFQLSFRSEDNFTTTVFWWKPILIFLFFSKLLFLKILKLRLRNNASFYFTTKTSISHRLSF